MVAPVLEQAAREQSDRLRVLTLDVDATRATARAYDILGTPTMILFRHGQPVRRLRAATSSTTGPVVQAPLLLLLRRQAEPELAQISLDAFMRSRERVLLQRGLTPGRAVAERVALDVARDGTAVTQHNVPVRGPDTNG